jgi:hypothetical protein
VDLTRLRGWVAFLSRADSARSRQHSPHQFPLLAFAGGRSTRCAPLFVHVDTSDASLAPPFFPFRRCFFHLYHHQYKPFLPPSSHPCPIFEHPQVLEGDGTIEEDEQNEDSDAEKDMDDGHRPLREISRRLAVMKDRAMLVNSEASAYIISSVALLSPSAVKASWGPVPMNLTQQPSPVLHTSRTSSSGSLSVVDSRFVYPASSKSSSMAYTCHAQRDE